MSGEDPRCGSVDDGGDHDFSNTLPLLEQLCWHVFCCGLIFDVFQDDLYPAINAFASAGDLPDRFVGEGSAGVARDAGERMRLRRGLT